jgi:hypothetical protein
LEYVQIAGTLMPVLAAGAAARADLDFTATIKMGSETADIQK